MKNKDTYIDDSYDPLYMLGMSIVIQSIEDYKIFYMHRHEDAVELKLIGDYKKRVYNPSLELANLDEFFNSNDGETIFRLTFGRFNGRFLLRHLKLQLQKKYGDYEEK